MANFFLELENKKINVIESLDKDFFYELKGYVDFLLLQRKFKGVLKLIKLDSHSDSKEYQKISKETEKELITIKSEIQNSLGNINNADLKKALNAFDNYSSGKIITSNSLSESLSDSLYDIIVIAKQISPDIKFLEDGEDIMRRYYSIKDKYIIRRNISVWNAWDNLIFVKDAIDSNWDKSSFLNQCSYGLFENSVRQISHNREKLSKDKRSEYENYLNKVHNYIADKSKNHSFIYFLNKAWRYIGVIATIIGLVAILFYPFFYNESSSVWSIYVVGPKLNVESQYPPVYGEPPSFNYSRALITYTNTGGIPLENLQVVYTFKLNENITIPSKTFTGLLSKKTLARGESGTFYITLKGVNKTDCSLLSPSIAKTAVYVNASSDRCFFYIFNRTQSGFCSPAKINFTIASAQTIFYKEIYYPVAVQSMDPVLWINNSFCEALEAVPSGLSFIGETNVSNFVEILGLNDSVKLSKKYCSERLMPLEWCVENDLM